MLFDTHMHTRFSTDSKMNIEDAISRAEELNLGITITEHMDLAYPKPQAFLFEVDEYFKAYNPYRSDSVLLGIEIGMRSDCLEENRRIIANNSFDYVIGSIHVIDNVDIYCESFYHSRNKSEVYYQYFEAMLECLKTYDFIDSLGHVDYIARYARYADPEVYYHESADQIDQIFKLLVARETALEINTRRLDSREKVEIILPLYRRFYELGGRFVTIGSDAHKADDVGKGLSVAREIADQCGLKIVVYKDRNPQYL